jgi:hypothetical protein
MPIRHGYLERAGNS